MSEPTSAEKDAVTITLLAEDARTLANISWVTDRFLRIGAACRKALEKDTKNG